MGEISIKMPSGKVVKVEGGRNAGETAESLGNDLPRDVIAFKQGEKIYDFTMDLPEQGELEAVTLESTVGLSILRHSAAHVLAAAVSRLYPGVKLWKGPAIEDERYGFYYDMDLGDDHITPEDFPRIQEEMARIVSEDQPFVRRVVPREEAIKRFKEEGDIYKEALAGQIPEGEPVSFYRSGDFEDLCKGPHVPSTGYLGNAYAIMSTAGAYFLDDEAKPMLTRVYGHAFASKEDLDAHLKKMEEIMKRDHRRLGRSLDIFSIQPDAGAGLVFWHRKGGMVRHIVEKFWIGEHLRRGYDIVYTPHIMKKGLWEKSGHYEFYKDLMFSPMEIEGQEYLLKPMNCPGHILIYKSKLWSYRELPLRLAELGTVYRYEKSGVLHGMLRVRGFTQDDAHIFCTSDQLEGEVDGCLELMDFLLKSFDYKYTAYLSTRPDKFIGDPRIWEEVEGILEGCLKKNGIPYEVDPGEGAFYAPKIDVKLVDVLGRPWQGPTIQVDFNLPERFDLKYRGKDGKDHRVFMIHRALLGSMERFIGGLLEHYGGAFPVWLAPVQIKILPVTEKNIPYAERLATALTREGIRVETDLSGEKIGRQVRRALYEEKVPFIGVVGEKEESQAKIALRHRKEGDQGLVDLETLVQHLKAREKDKT